MSCKAFLGTAEVKLQVDVGYGDVVTPGPVDLEYPSLLDFEPPRLLAYTPETVVAEKLEAMVKLDTATSSLFFRVRVSPKLDKCPE